MAATSGPTSNRNWIGRVLLMAGLLTILTSGLPLSAETDDPIPALQRYPWLEDYFPYGFWYGQAPYDERLAGGFKEPYEARREKLFDDLARHHINAIIPANRLARPEALNVAEKYGLRMATSAGYLYAHVDQAGNLQGEASMAEVKQQCSAHAGQIKNHPALLAYIVYDEPRAKVAPKIQQVVDVFHQADPNHPPIYTQSDIPLDQGRVDEWQLLQSLDVLLSDCYSIAARSGRDPWLYGDVYIPELRRANPDALNWPIVQAFTKGYPIWSLPTLAELRVMVYHTIASGAKGMLFFTTGQAYITWSRTQWFYRGAGNAWFGREDMLEEIGRIGAHLTTAGPLLIPLRYAPDYPVYVGAADSPADAAETFQAYVRGGFRPSGELQRPAIHVGAFTGPDYDVLVIHNNDPWRSHSASVTLGIQRENVFNLAALERMPLTGGLHGATFSVRLEPGDGRLYLAGDDAAVDAARTAVLRRRYDHQVRMLRLDAELAERCGVDISAADALLQGAASTATGDDPAVALDVLEQARSALRKAEDAMADYAAVRDDIEAGRRDFDRMDVWFHSAPIQPNEPGAAPSLVELEARVFALLTSFCAIENALRAGKLDVTAAYVLRRETAQLKSDVLGYRPPDLAKGSIAVIELSPDAARSPDPEARALANRLRWMFDDVEQLTVQPDGRLVDATGDQADLTTHDMVWIHIDGRSSAAQARYCAAAALAPGIPHAQTVAALRQFADGGGGLVLSGLATCLGPDLGLEAYRPNHCYWGTMVVPGHEPSRHRPATTPAVKSLGLKPMVPDHPLFLGLPADGFETMPFNPSELVTEALWQRPPEPAEAWRAPWWPEKGRVLAGYWADGVDIPGNYAAIVEYEAANGGKAILLGGAFDPRAGNARARRGEHYDQLIRNVVAYCSRGK